MAAKDIYGGKRPMYLMHKVWDTVMQEIRRHSFLQLLDDESAQRLMDASQSLPLQNGERLFSEGDLADSLYLVLQGAVRLTKKDPTGKEHVLAIVRENDFFGEFGVLDGLPRSASAIGAEGETLLLKVPAAIFVEVFHVNDNKAVVKLALHIIGKVRETNERYVEERLHKERMTMIGEMAQSVIHDLRNPFTVIQMALYLVQMKTLPEETLKHCAVIEEQISRMQQMVDEILEFCRGKPQLHITTVHLNDLFARVGKLQAIYQAQGVQLVLEPIDVAIRADENKILRVIQNLVGNAADAFEGKPGQITIKAAQTETGVRISIQDNGRGIPKEIQASLFEVFATCNKRKGIGLGLAISKSFAEAHQGKLTFESEEGKGTTFFIDLPLAPR
jgi:signal transduction histidine kinase